ncbi:hypothetical protein [Paracoccus yeei]
MVLPAGSLSLMNPEAPHAGQAATGRVRRSGTEGRFRPRRGCGRHGTALRERTPATPRMRPC